jgi:hypothetical protein
MGTIYPTLDIWGLHTVICGESGASKGGKRRENPFESPAYTIGWQRTAGITLI